MYFAHKDINFGRPEAEYYGLNVFSGRKRPFFFYFLLSRALVLEVGFTYISKDK